MIRAFTPEDAPPAAEMLRASFEAAYRGRASDAALDAQLESMVAPAILASVAERAARGAVVLVAEDAHGLVGYAAAGPSRDADRDPAGSGEIYSLYIHPRVWRAGIGRALQREVLEHLRIAGAKRADLWVLSANENALDFYDRTGWRRDRAERVIDFLGGTPVVRYTRPLADVRPYDPTTDARTIAEVHIGTWRDTYRGQMPDVHLDSLDVVAREEFWRRQTGENNFVAVLDGSISGFVSVGVSRDTDAGATGHELYALNVRAHGWGSGAGLALLRTGEATLRGVGAADATLWVLATNARARHFYEREGWTVDGAEQTATLSGTEVTEVRYRKTLDPK